MWRTYRQTDWTIHRAAWSQLKISQVGEKNGYEMMHKAWSSIEEVPYCFLYIMSHCATCKTSDYFSSIPLSAPGPYKSLLAHTYILNIWINVDIYMSLYLKTRIIIRSHSSIIFCTLYLFLNSRLSIMVFCQRPLGSSRLPPGSGK